MKNIVLQKILKELEKIETEKKVKILFACEAGSRAWGFPSPDSDFDVRFVYYKPLKSYLSIEEKKDTINIPIDSELDINGWDLKKYLKHIYKSNPTVFEWLQSPISYKSQSKELEELVNISNDFFAEKAMIHHYLGISRNAYRTCLDNKIRIKKLFYVLRPLLAAFWICEKQTIPPMIFADLIPLIKDKFIVEKIEELLIEKSKANESFVIDLDLDIKNFIEELFKYCGKKSTYFKQKNNVSEKLDNFFYKIIK